MKRVLFAALSFGAALLACASAIPDTVPNRGLSSGTDNFGNNHLFKRAPTRVGCTCEDLNYLIGGKDQGDILYGGKTARNPEGWCYLSGGVMNSTFQADIFDAINRNAVGRANGTLARVYCKAVLGSSYTSTQCSNRIISDFRAAIGDSSLAVCTYPSANFVPLDCSCGWSCVTGYTKCGNNCIKDGVQTCVSGVPVNVVKRSGSPLCPTSFSLCPVGKTGWECLDTATDLEACGGCPGTSDAVDCSTLPGVSSVDCVAGTCQVRSCARGFTMLNGECYRKH